MRCPRDRFSFFGITAVFTYAVLLYPAPANADLSETVKSFFSWSKKQSNDDSCNTASGEIKKVPTAAPPPKNPAFKSEGELNHYLSCYAVLPGRYEAYKEWAPYIRTSAREFGVSESFLTCLLFRESRFDPNARSKSGALGLAQFLRSTMPTITNIIEAGQVDTDEVKRLNKLAEKDVSKPQDRKDKTYAITRLKMIAVGMKWNSYFEQLRSQKKYKRDTPNKFDKSMALNPAAAIGAAGLYLRYIIDHFHDALKGQGAEGTSLPAPGLDFHLAAAGAYNLGEGTAIKLLKEVHPPDPTKWKERLLKSRDETRDYILSIANCATSSKHDAKIAFQPPASDHPRDCENGGAINGERVKLGPMIGDSKKVKSKPKNSKAPKRAATTTGKKASKK